MLSLKRCKAKGYSTTIQNKKLFSNIVIGAKTEVPKGDVVWARSNVLSTN